MNWRDTEENLESSPHQPLSCFRFIDNVHKTQQSRDDASTLQHLKTLNDELSKLSVVPLPDLHSIKYSHKKVTDSNIDQLIGTYSLTVDDLMFNITP
jgi:hypothetical protein